ncbi:MAG: amidohydrolase family protein [Alphaproteobacteria bacterium]|nr:amidohydrolase family protein [Alphaproteobacteria bacterium]
MSASAATQRILLQAGIVIDGTGRAPFPADVVIEGNTIASVGSVASNAETRRIDARGLTVMPGLIDAHCHLTFDDAGSNPEIFHQRRHGLSALVAGYNAGKLLRAGVTGILDPDSVHECGVDVRDAIEAGVVEGPRIAAGCYALIPKLGGTAGQLIADKGITGYYKVVEGRDEIVSEVRRQVKVGADWIKVHVSGVAPRYAHRGELCHWTQDELDLICAVAHDLGVPVMGHCRGDESSWRSARAGMDLLFHATGLAERTVAAIIERGIPVCPAFTFQANLVEYGHRIGTDPALIKLFEREITDSADSLRRLHAAGVPLLTGSEAGFTMVPYGHWHHREMEVFVRYLGLTPLQAIQCATQAGARALKLDGKVGVIAPGMLADVICVAGDPSRDVGVLGDPANIRHVFVDGRAIDLSPQRARRPIPGWRLPSMGAALTRAVALGAAKPGSG